ncbi:hypothetical protein BO94DRAFT_529673 [Aspergillus sclerotioniger CBS 115572]|uniref:DUF7726 domain-containing protein n=1 Tax=Aspergillus sclerotioniger CBS 115572 TaxID=1450535 RepID=A0A317XGB2_9EURO|nr:hypothetical protein BO94DRAFT_529673 [Aspergillus sclerotioniger CBS 115572]PWY96278.1 hypothetical protein BO94DRAFT_529673 [Aspergillus sclerotioniger CBS 115572]
MSAAEFQRAIDVSPRSYSEFLNQEGTDKGARSATYRNAVKFFQDRRGGVMPLTEVQPATVPGVQSAEVPVEAPARAPAPVPEPASTMTSAVPTKKTKKNPAPASGFDLSAIHLDGDEDMKVPIFETCDVVRKKMKAHLRKPGVTQAGFLRDMAKAAFPQTAKRLSSKSMADFLSYKGPTTGSSGVIFYAAYVFFEKLRVRDGKPKNEFRLEMEKIWPNGFERDNPANGKLWCGPHERPWIDKYGRLQFR